MRTKEEILKKYNFVEFNLKCKYNFKFFCEELLGVTTYGGIHEYQEKWVELAEKYERVVIEAAAGFSKTQIMGVFYILWILWRKKDQEILLVSKTLGQAEKNILFRIKRIIMDNEMLSEVLGDKDTALSWNAQEIRTKQGNWVINVPYNENIRGYRAHYIICDEADTFEETDTYFEHVTSRPHPGGKIIIISTPGGATNLIYQLKQNDPEMYHFENTPAILRKDKSKFDPETFNISMFDEAISIWPERWPVKELSKKWDEQGKWKWITNYLCIILGESESTPFPMKNIVECYRTDLTFSKEAKQNAIYFIGSDFASSSGPKADYTVNVVIEFLNGEFTLKWISIPRKGIKRPEKVKDIKELYDVYNKYGCCRVIADDTNIGPDIISDLRSLGITTIQQPFQWRLRREMLKTASNVLQGGKVHIPKKGGGDHINNDKLINELQKQLTGFLVITSNSGNELYKSTASHDDIAIAFCMALKEASKQVISSIRPIISGLKNNEDNIKRELGNPEEIKKTGTGLYSLIYKH